MNQPGRMEEGTDITDVGDLVWKYANICEDMYDEFLKMIW